MCINRKNKELAKDVKDEIIKQEIIAKGKNKIGLILLAGSMLTLGITLDKCDVVILMNNTLSSDKILQEMYRCMTEADNKKIGIVVDLNICRVLNTCINYSTYKNDKSIEDKISYLVKNNLINIDEDIMLNKNANSDIIIKKLKLKIQEGLNPKREIYLCTKDQRQIPLTRVGEPLLLSSIEEEAVDLSLFLNVPLES